MTQKWVLAVGQKHPCNQNCFLLTSGIFIGNAIYNYLLFICQSSVGISIRNAMYFLFIIRPPEYRLEIHVLLSLQLLGMGLVSHKDKSCHWAKAATPKHDGCSERQSFFLQITTPKHEGTFGGVVRELTHVIFGDNFASANVTERCKGGIWGAAMVFCVALITAAKNPQEWTASLFLQGWQADFTPAPWMWSLPRPRGARLLRQPWATPTMSPTTKACNLTV